MYPTKHFTVSFNLTIKFVLKKGEKKGMKPIVQMSEAKSHAESLTYIAWYIFASFSICFVLISLT